MSGTTITVLDDVVMEVTPGLPTEVRAVTTSAEDDNDDDMASLPTAAATQPAAALGAENPGTAPDVAKSNTPVAGITSTGTTTGVGFSEVDSGPLVADGLFALEGKQTLLYSDECDHRVALGRAGLGAITADAIRFALALEDVLAGDVISGADIHAILCQPLSRIVDGAPSVANCGDSLDLDAKLFVTASEGIVFSDFTPAPSGQQLHRPRSPSGTEVLVDPQRRGVEV